MARDNDISDLMAFLAVARERSFTRAAAKLGVSQSALSHTLRAMEARMGLRLLTRTTRSVAPTEAGERLLQTVGPRLDEIEAELRALKEMRDQPAGTVRITAIDFAVDHVIWPRLAPLLLQYPDIQVEVSVDYRLTDIVADGFDIGVRHGDQVEKDMIAVPVDAPMQMAMVASPAYFARHPVPRTPQDLTTSSASRCACPPRAGSMRGSWKRAGRSCKPGCPVRWCSTACTRWSMPRCRAWAWPSCPTTWWPRMWPRATWCG